MKNSKKTGFTVLIIVIAVSVVLGALNILDNSSVLKNKPKQKHEIKKIFKNEKNGYIAKLDITGVIQDANRTYNQEWLLSTIKQLKEDSNNKAIALFINSPGGAVYEADEAYLALQDYKTSGKKIYAYQSKLAASGGYYISCAANKIYANRNTLTGSIGVISGSSFDMTELLSKIGIKSTTIHSGRNKTMFNYNEPLTKEQIEIMQSISDEIYGQFIGIVAMNRNLILNDVKKLADGRIYTAKQALENGLIDSVDSWENMIKDMRETEFEGKELPVKEFSYERDFTVSDLFYGKAPALSEGVKSIEDLISEAKLTYPAYLYK